MKISVVVCLLLAVATLTSATPLRNKAVKAVGKDVLLFLEGFAIGIETELGNLTECTKDQNLTLDEFLKGYAEIKGGIAHLSKRDIENGLKLWAQALLGVVPLLEACGAIELAEDIAKLVERIQSGQVLHVIVEEIVNIISHGRELRDDFESAIKAFEREDYKSAGIATGKIVAILLEVKKKRNTLSL